MKIKYTYNIIDRKYLRNNILKLKAAFFSSLLVLIYMLIPTTYSSVY
jgi:hypothetical protein